MSEATMTEVTSRIEVLRQRALEHVRSEHFDEALSLYDEALGLTADEEARELITINKGHALIAAERTGPEVKALPLILMRRRNPRHTFLSAYALMYTHRLTNESKRAIFYGQIALEAATESEQTLWKVAVLNELGIIYETDSQFGKAMESFSQALTHLDENGVTDSAAQFSRVAIITNLGDSTLLSGDSKEGLRLIHSVIDQIATTHAKSDAYGNLSYGYLDLGDFEKARGYGEQALEFACEERQIRNAHYLIGEAAYKAGDVDVAEEHFEALARFYPQFRHLKSLLFAIDLRSMINLKL
jgi:tetratricopeptide (TPR) repeat protein